jgi:hypothetical protein
MYNGGEAHFALNGAWSDGCRLLNRVTVCWPHGQYQVDDCQFHYRNLPVFMLLVDLFRIFRLAIITLVLLIMSTHTGNVYFFNLFQQPASKLCK